MSGQHIAFLISDMGAGGAQRVASILCNQWASSGYKVTIVTFEAENTEPFYELDKKIHYRSLNLMKRSRNPLDAVFFNIKRVFDVYRCFKDTEPDIVISFMSESNVIGILSTLLSKIPIIISERSNPDVIPQSRFWRFLRRMTYPLADMIVCQTQYAKDFFSFHKNTVVIFNPIHSPEGAKSQDFLQDQNQSISDIYDLIQHRPFISALGRLGHEKGFDILIDAFAKIANRIPNHHVIIVGEGSERVRLEQKIREYNLEQRIHLTGQIANPFHILCKSSLFVMPSRFEGFPNALCEAMVHGLPVIASDQATQHLSIIEDRIHAVIVSADHVDKLSEQIVDLLKNPGKLKLLGQSARDIQQHVSTPRVCDQWNHAISTLL